MAGYGRQRRTIRRLWSLLSVAGTTVGVAAATAPASDICGAGSEVASPTPAMLDRATTANGAFAVEAKAGAGAGTLTPTSAAGAGCGLAEAPTLTGFRLPPATDLAPDTTWYERIGEAALAKVTYPWTDRLAGWSIVFLPGRPGLLGGTWTYEQRIEIYVRESQTAQDVAFTLAHELGHAVDVTLMSEHDRQRWKTARAIDAAVPWWVESGATDFSSGSGDWAEAFAVWQIGGESHSRVAPQPSPAQLKLLADLSGN